ncbi:MAG: glucose 1-dehydrogenase [Gemmataceae bacterium]|nr:glucose 1-dehydrogenase [Gemmataceae bacterium]
MQANPSSGRVAGRVALVTGAASGIGRASAILLAHQGASVAVCDIDTHGADAVAETIAQQGRTALSFRLDVASETDWQAAVRRVVTEWAKLDIAVNNAGIADARPILDMSLADWRRTMAVNLDGVFLGTKHAVQAMRQGWGGSIVNVASSAGIKASPGASAYCASKAAVRQFSKAIALECAERGDRIRVNTVCPGGVLTSLWEKAHWWPKFVAGAGGVEAAVKKLAETTPLKRFATPEEIAQSILFLASDESSYMTGADVVIDGGYTA